MYTLRTWRSNSEETNQWIGDNFRIVMRENNEENFIAEWCFHTKTTNPTLLDPEVIGMIYSEQVEMPLVSNTHYYIMTESGKTFKHIYVTQTKEEWNSSAALNDFTGELRYIGGELRAITGKGKVSSTAFSMNTTTDTATSLPQDATLTNL
jgi:hypothetical protein